MHHSLYFQYVTNDVMKGHVVETPLAHACARGFQHLAELMITYGADVNFTSHVSSDEL